MTTLCDSSDDFFCPADCKTARGSQIYTIFKHKYAHQAAKIPSFNSQRSGLDEPKKKQKPMVQMLAIATKLFSQEGNNTMLKTLKPPTLQTF
jgi:hypothetical protein